MDDHELDQVLRQASNRLDTRADHDPAAVLSGLTPRLRRARTVRRLQFAGGFSGVLLLVGLAVVAGRGGPDGEDLRTATPPPAPTEVTTPSPDAVPEPSPTASAGPTPTAIREAEAAPQVTPGPTDVPAPTAAPAPTATPESTPTSVESTPTTAPQAGQAVQDTPAGRVTVRHDGTSIQHPVNVSPNAGWTFEIEKAEPTEAKVTFETGDAEVEVEIKLEDGQVRFDVSQDSNDNDEPDEPDEPDDEDDDEPDDD